MYSLWKRICRTGIQKEIKIGLKNTNYYTKSPIRKVERSPLSLPIKLYSLLNFHLSLSKFSTTRYLKIL